jgi:hypothetical protein
MTLTTHTHTSLQTGHALFMGIFVICLTGTHCYFVSVDRTTNEASNWYRYDHLRNRSGKLTNPFDRGVFANWMHMIKSYQSFPFELIQDQKSTEKQQKHKQKQRRNNNKTKSGSGDDQTSVMMRMMGGGSGKKKTKMKDRVMYENI